ncbi:DUF7946 domain-containing protein [Sphingomicrobium aestuariivivum]|uniref:DUF7946 domain-containing protein n=1 Tax=Sphingomicrobium aestuariivivum TaxID=1582356 RepID=UPI001FD6655C|nr:hypothetical protein [Sphingomicrobium aestuariivivum]MCJ8190859.1 hypothetical protein [Sphingomicrobium aestuariivivum]
MSDLIISFQGLDASEGHIEAFAGLESVAGVARALTLVAHYAATGEVRHRYPFSDDVQFFLEDTEEGSFNFRLRLAIATAVSAPIVVSMTHNAVYDLTKTVFQRCIGIEPQGVAPQISDLDRTRGGDINALIEAVEPALKKSHYGVGDTTAKITLREEHTQEIIVRFDNESKLYLTQDIAADDDVQQVSISALNANDRTGRAYFLDLKRTVPFRISKHAAPDTLSILSRSLDDYVNEDPSPVQISFERIEAADGRLKRVVIYKAEDVAGSN